MKTQPAPGRPLRREMQLLVGSLLALLSALIVVAFALSVLILQMNRLEASSRSVADAVAPSVGNLPPAELQERLDALREYNGIARVEIFRDGEMVVSSGRRPRSAQVITQAIPRGWMSFEFDVAGSLGGRRRALATGALMTLATIGGLLILIVYLPKFVRPIEELLAEAARLGSERRGDDDARFLVNSFREAVERIRDQSNELSHLRTAASSTRPDIHALAGALEQSFNSGFLAADRSGSVIAINRSGRAMLGLGEDDPPVPFPLDQLPSAFGELLRSALGQRAAVTRREVVLEGSQVVIGATTAPLFEQEEFIGMFALFTDLKAFHAMEQRMRDVESLVALGQMSAGIAHEFRNSLFAILGYLRLARRTESPETAIRNAETEAAKLSAAVDALLNFARPIELNPRPLRLDETVGGVVDRLATEYPSVSFTKALEPITIEGDGNLLERAFENVLRNAVDAVQQQHPDGGGVIEIEATAEPHPSIRFADNGVGLDPAQAAALLLPFQSGKPHGFGLGLPLARKIVVHHGGAITLDGSPGSGAVVRIDFDAASIVTKSNIPRTT